jgi:hypothetical protein
VLFTQFPLRLISLDPLFSYRPPKKYLHAQNDDNYKASVHELHDTQTLADQVCRYDLDDEDVAWLKCANDELESIGSFLQSLFIQCSHHQIIIFGHDFCTMY